MHDLRNELNENQYEAVSHIDGPLLILAGAGSGKTRVITYRIANLIKNHGVNPAQILALTFTNKAAREMKERVDKQLEGTFIPASNLLITTFHACCLRFLKWKYRDDFVVYDPVDQVAVMKNIVKAMNLDIKQYTPKKVLGRISNLKNEFIYPENYKPRFNFGWDKIVATAYPLYQKQLKDNNAMDFDDLLCQTVLMIKNSQEISDFFTSRYRYLLVDEYQDTNKVQYMLIKELTKTHKNICVVGDDDQSIYKWRGASIDNILNFSNDFKDDDKECKVIKLEENYRSTNKILKASSALVSNNIRRTNKTLYSKRNGGEDIKILIARDGYQEVDAITTMINKNVQIGRKYSEFAVFYRTNAQSRAFEDGMRINNIPYQLVGGTKFYDRKEIKDMIAYLRLIINPHDNVSFQRVINFPKRKIGNATIEKLMEFAAEHEVSLYDSIFKAEDYGLFNKGVTTKLMDFCHLIKKLEMDVRSFQPSAIIAHVYKSAGLEKALEEIDLAHKTERKENLLEFVTAAQDFEKNIEGVGKEALISFLGNLSLSEDFDRVDEKKDAITLMTLHSSKGLEFPYVFLTGMEEGLLPHYIASKSEDDIEEERRLCYVGMTRAKEHLMISCARTRHIFGQFMANRQSRFLDEVPKDDAEIYYDASQLT
ncbi:MAG: UvrD-helicase domain-containing protein [Nitrospinae bacterium]|nr:UvrD-helicase domain-containing protein [Nitrospinota bacterium]